MRIGLLGNLGNGRVTFTRLWKDMRFPFVDGELMVTELLTKSPVFAVELRNKFGAYVMDGDVIDITGLSNFLRNDTASQAIFNKLIHPMIKHRIDTLLRQGESEHGAVLYSFPVSPCASTVPELHKTVRVVSSHNDRIGTRHANEIESFVTKTFDADIPSSDIIIEHDVSKDMRPVYREIIYNLVYKEL